MMKSSLSVANRGPRTRGRNWDRAKVSRIPQQSPYVRSGGRFFPGQVDGDAFAENRYIPNRALQGGRSVSAKKGDKRRMASILRMISYQIPCPRVFTASMRGKALPGPAYYPRYINCWRHPQFPVWPVARRFPTACGATRKFACPAISRFRGSNALAAESAADKWAARTVPVRVKLPAVL